MRRLTGGVGILPCSFGVSCSRDGWRGGSDTLPSLVRLTSRGFDGDLDAEQWPLTGAMVEVDGAVDGGGGPSAGAAFGEGEVIWKDNFANSAHEILMAHVRMRNR